jgi:hypothetical protein
VAVRFGAAKTQNREEQPRTFPLATNYLLQSTPLIICQTHAIEPLGELICINKSLRDTFGNVYSTWTGYRGRDRHRLEPYDEWPPWGLLLVRKLGGMYHRGGLFWA